MVEIAGAVWFLSRYRCRLLPDDERFTFAIGYHVLALRPLPQRHRHRPAPWGRSSTKAKTFTLSRPMCREVKEWIRSRLGVFYINVIHALEAEAKAKAQQQEAERDALGQPFRT